jgi:AraC-like DNA-binding protein
MLYFKPVPMVVKYIKPTAVLSEFVHSYWVLEIDASEGEVEERVIPTGAIQLMFHYKTPFVCKNEKERIVQPRSFVSGISSSWTDVAACGNSGVIAVVFRPFGACNFIKTPLHYLENASVNLLDTDDACAKIVEERINLANSVPERVAILENYLLGCFKPVDKSDLQLIKNVVITIMQHRGRITASDVSKRLFLTEKTLERKCAALIGISPKQFIRIIRFQEVIKGFTKRGNKLLSELSCENGFFDQAHFIKDFKAMSGFTPKEFLSKYPCATGLEMID